MSSECQKFVAALLPPPSNASAVRQRRNPARRNRQLAAFALIALALTYAFHWRHAAVAAAGAGATRRRWDCVVVPGGGLDAERQPAAWVRARLDAALAHDQEAARYLVLSRGTTHRAPPLDARGFPVDEAAASAAYLVAHGVAPERVLLESWSFDTIGNAAFARLMHADLRGWRSMLVITSEFHLRRTRAIFDWVFALPDAAGRRRGATELAYEAVGDRGLAEEHLASRVAKEAAALAALRDSTMADVADLAALSAFLFERHGAYRAADGAAGRGETPGHLAASY